MEDTYRAMLSGAKKFQHLQDEEILIGHNCKVVGRLRLFLSQRTEDCGMMEQKMMVPAGLNRWRSSPNGTSIRLTSGQARRETTDGIKEFYEGVLPHIEACWIAWTNILWENPESHRGIFNALPYRWLK